MHVLNERLLRNAEINIRPKLSSLTRVEAWDSLGVEFANGGNIFFFIDARYMRFKANGQNLDFIPIRLGLRF